MKCLKMFRINKPVKIILVLMTLAAALKVSMFGRIVDEGYAFAIGGRLLAGDILLRDMWELHQTSGFAVEFFLWLYRCVTGTSEGEVLFVRLCGAAIQLAVSYIVYRALKKHVPADAAFAAAILYANLTPKQLSTPEFSNLLNWTATLTLICLDLLIEEIRKGSDKKKILTCSVITGLFLSLCVLSYPPALIFAVFVFGLLIAEKKKGLKPALTLVSVCGISGALYMAGILRYISLGELVNTVSAMIEVDFSHAEGASKFVRYAGDAGVLILFVAGFGTVSYLLSRVLKNKELLFPVSLLIIFVWKFLHILLKTDFYSVEYTFGGILFVCVIGLFCIFRDKLCKGEAAKMLRVYGTGSVGILLTVLVACDQSVFSSGKYLGLLTAVLSAVILGKAVTAGQTENKESSSAPENIKAERAHEKVKEELAEVSHRYRLYRAVTAAGVCFVILVNIIQLGNPRNRLLNILDADARVPAGPEKGLIMERMFANKARIDSYELPEALDGASYVMITGDAMPYIYTTARIGHGSTIMTEDYGERFALYWEMYPEKLPDIIAIECYNGSVESTLVGSWLYEYLENDFGADEVRDLTYYRLYIRKRTEE